MKIQEKGNFWEDREKEKIKPVSWDTVGRVGTFFRGVGEILWALGTEVIDVVLFIY